MALFANTTAVDFQKGNIIMFAMGSSSHGRVPSRADRSWGSICLRPDVLWGVFNHRRCHKWLFGACGVCFGDEKGFNVGFNSKLP